MKTTETENLEATRQIVDSYWKNEFDVWSKKVGAHVTKIFKDEICFIKDGKEVCVNKSSV
jgi:hypothetical protein